MEKISCLCVSRGNIFDIENMIRCFLAQTYKNLELVVVLHGEHLEAKQLIESKVIGSKVIMSDIDKSLGELRNISLKIATGSLVATWDDDDEHAPERLMKQKQALDSGDYDVCFLERVLIEKVGTGVWLGNVRAWENTMLARKNLNSFIEGYLPINQNEDSELSGKIQMQNKIILLNNPHLYTYRFTGRNVWGWDHFYSLTGPRLI